MAPWDAADHPSRAETHTTLLLERWIGVRRRLS